MGARHFSVTQDVDGTYLFKGELTIHDLDYLKDFLESSAARSKKVAVSFAEVSFVDTAALQFLAAFRRFVKKDKQWEVTGLSEEMEKILAVSGLKVHIV